MLTLSKERAEREQAATAANKLQWVESQRAAERIAFFEAAAWQQEDFVEQNRQCQSSIGI